MQESTPKILFERFELIDTLKKDQHTSVYLANHIYLGKKIILKTLSADEIPDKTFLERFKREAKVLAQLDHPNIIKVLDFGTAVNNFYISFEYFEGKNLRSIIKENNLSEEDKIHLCIQLFSALNIAHQNGVIHRDIKPENILVNSKHELKIADFGLALVNDENILTHKSSIVGTPGYMSPEQIRGEELTPQTDLFSSGIVIYELFTNTNPLIGKDISETINNILNFKIEKEFIKLPSLPGNVQNAIKDLLRKNFSKRTKTALEALSYFNFHEKIKSELKPEAERKERKFSIIYWAAAVLIITIAAFLIESNLSSEKKFIKPFPKDEQITIKPEIKESISTNLNEKKVTENDPEKIQDEKPATETVIPTIVSLYGKLFVEANPWAEIYIDNRKIDTTPLAEQIELPEGEYELKLMHPDFPVYVETIEIKPEEPRIVKMNFNEKVGFLDCRIFPWGDIFINGTYNNTSPLRKPIVLMPGTYNLKITNPNYKDKDEVVTIKEKETVMIRHNFDQLEN